MQKNNRPDVLKPRFSPLSMWAFSIGASIGWGSFIVTCNTYLQKSGLLGTVFGLLLGMAVILVITWNLQYMIRSAPDAGGVYAFEKKVAGKDFGFLALWFVLLTYLAILWANITSVPLFARFFLGDTFRFGFHYSIFGYEVWLGEALLSMCAVALTALVCARSARLPGRVTVAAALVFAGGFTVCAVIAIFRHESGFSFSPLYTGDSTAFSQIVRIAAISPWAFIGFENISHFSEEYRFPVRRVRSVLISSVVVTTVLYLFVSLLSVSAYPPEYDSWLAYIRDMGNLSGIKAVPAFYAAGHYLGRTGVVVLMLSLFGVIVTSLIGNMLALSRLLYAAGRDGEAPAALGRLSARGIPAGAVLAVAAVSVCIPFLGRTAIGWIVDVTTLGATLIYGMISHAVFRHARQSGRSVEKATGLAGIGLMACFILLLMIPGLLPFHAMEIESYVLFIVWSVLGLVYFRRLVRRDRGHGYGQRVIVWVILLVMVLFASMMWVSRATENAAQNAVERIIAYHESHPADDSDASVREDRTVFLQEQAKSVSSANLLYSGVSLGLFVLFFSMMLGNYRDTQRLGMQLDRAEKEAEDARRIAVLQQSITSLLDNMPGMCFSKDTETGVYLACNQAFAEYAHRENPDGVTGLTDAQIFDPATAEHFMEDDRMALSMEKPYIFFEDVLDAAGNSRQLQTTKLKFVDASGRLCLLSICQDVTDMVRIQREHATTREAYEKARSTGLIYTHIAQTLALSYMTLFYVNLTTDDFIEYRTGEAIGSLTEKRRGERFFEECRKKALERVYPDDREGFLNAMERGALLRALDRGGAFMLTCRMLTENGPTYVSMKASRMADDKNHIIIAMTNVDEQLRERQAAARVKEERAAYARLSALTGDILCVYIVDPADGRYREYSVTEGFDAFSLPVEGPDFFSAMREICNSAVDSEDIDRFLATFTAERVKTEIARNGIFAMTFRLIIGGRHAYVKLKAALVEEKEGTRLIVGINDIDTQMRQEQDYTRRLAQAQSKASVDALTGVRNKHAYLDAQEQLDQEIAGGAETEFAIIILDLNDLKKINDTAGHQAGDQYIREACKTICNIFKRSPVFRVGGDEFAVIARGDDYRRIDELLGQVDAHNAEALRGGGIVIARGMARYHNDAGVAAVFERADQNMYENKSALKVLRKDAADGRR